MPFLLPHVREEPQPKSSNSQQHRNDAPIPCAGDSEREADGSGAETNGICSM